MCLFRRKPQPITGNKVALLFGINKYGGGNDLAGCINDIEDVEKKLRSEFPDFQVRKFIDVEVTTQRFMAEIENAYNTMQLPGHLYLHYSGHGCQVPNIMEVNKYDEALYLINGPLVDDNIWALQQRTPAGLIVTAKFDSCFSGGMDRAVRKGKSKFIPMPGMRIMPDAVRKFNKTESDQWIIFSACLENQVASDAVFNGRANGSFTYYDLQSFSPESNNSDEIAALRTQLPNTNFEQVPTLYGNNNLFNRLVLT